jgi:hypothetical protein
MSAACCALRRHRLPPLREVSRAARAALEARGLHVVAYVFWGRQQFTEILWPYLERNLAVNGGACAAVGSGVGCVFGVCVGW